MRRLMLVPGLVLLVAAVAVRADPPPPPTTGSVTGGAEASGRITDLDREKGKVEIKLSNGEELTLSMPQSALRGFNEGDTVVVSSRITVNEVPRSATVPPDNQDSED